MVAADGALPAAVREDVLPLVTELVNNAVRHSGVGADRSLRVDIRIADRCGVSHGASSTSLWFEIGFTG